MTEKVALIFGISGQDGAYLAHLLLTKGYQVYGASRDAEVNSFAHLVRLKIRDRVKIFSASLNDFRSTISLLTTVRPAEIYNLAGQSSVALSFDQPVETFESITVSTLNILECIRFSKLPIRFFNAVSSDCFGGMTEAATEETPFHPRSPYAMAKATAFWTAGIYRDAYGMYACSGILSNHESPLRPDRFVCRKIVKAAVRIAEGSKEHLTLGNVKICRDWGLAAEYMDAVWRMLQLDAPEDFIIATGHTSTLEDFVTEAFASLGLDARKYTLNDDALLRPLDPPATRLDPSKAFHKLAWRAKTKMPELARLLVECEKNNSIDPLPWMTV